MIRRHSDYRDGPELPPDNSPRMLWIIVGGIVMICSCFIMAAIFAFVLRSAHVTYKDVFWQPHHEIH